MVTLPLQVGDTKRHMHDGGEIQKLQRCCLFFVYLSTAAGIMAASSAASIVCCHVFVDPGITNPK